MIVKINFFRHTRRSVRIDCFVELDYLILYILLYIWLLGFFCIYRIPAIFGMVLKAHPIANFAILLINL